jgi:hypothetical protein
VKDMQIIARMIATVMEIVEGIAMARECFLLFRLFLMRSLARLRGSFVEAFSFCIVFRLFRGNGG